jgi:hypothetical protein
MAKTNHDKLLRYLDKHFPGHRPEWAKQGMKLFPPLSLPRPDTAKSGFVLVHGTSSDKSAIQNIRRDFRIEWGAEIPVSAWS